VRVVFVAIGDELLRGESREGNGAVLADLLTSRGLRLAQVRVVPDDFAAISRALSELCEPPGLVVVSGGLGPTDDDFTRQAVAFAVGVPVVCDEDVLAGLRARYAKVGREMHPSNARQAEFPQGSQVLANEYGTAPGFALRHPAVQAVASDPERVPSSLIACFPGVPREFAGMLADHLDRLLAEAGVQDAATLAKTRRREVTLRLFGIPESDMQGVLTGLPHYRSVAMRSLPTFPEIRLKLAELDDAAGYDAMLAETRAALGWRIYGEGDHDSHAAATLRALQAGGLTLAVAESCTGGLIGHLLTEVPGASASLLLDAVVYANSAKTAVLGVPEALLASHGAVSEEVARAMAEGVRHCSGASLAIATTGIAGPDGGTASKPVGTFCLAVADARGTRSRQLSFVGLDRSRWKRVVAHSALAEVRRAALGWADRPPP